MGNRLSLLEHEDSYDREVEADLIFYRNAKTKFVKSFFAQIAENMLSDFDIYNDQDTVSWMSYLKLFCTVRDKRNLDIETNKRSVWHPATNAYIMERAEVEDAKEYNDEEEARNKLRDRNEPADDHTDDDGSEVSHSEDEDDSDDDSNDEDEEEEENVETDRVKFRRKPRPGWDSQTTSPIFFGYTMRSVAQYEIDVVLEAAQLKEAEERAVVRTKVSRGTLLDTFEATSKNQEANRLKKIKKLEDQYNVARTKREAVLKRMQADLPPLSFRAFKTTWEQEYQAAEDAFDEEIGKMRDFHETQCAADISILTNRREELEAFKDAESQSRPSAGRLEEIARVELARWIDETVTRQTTLQENKEEFVQNRDEYTEANKRGANAKELQTLKSVMNVSETGVREGQRGLNEALDGLNDSEILLNRAVRIKQSQIDSLPLFRMLCNEESELSEVRIDLLVCAMTALMDATYDQKCAFLFNLFDSKGEGLYSGPFICKVAMLFGEVFYRIEMLPAPPVLEDVQNSIFRAFYDIGLEYKSDALTLPEAKRVLITLCSSSYPLANALAVRLGFPGMKGVQDMTGRRSSLGGGFMGTYQRNKMTAIGSLLKGMIGPSACKYRLHIEATKYHKELEFTQKQTIHERAMAQGEDDPLRTDYSRYFNKSGDKGHKVLPLDLGHLRSLRYHTEAVLKVQAAVRIQSMIRARFGRKAALTAAKKQAYADAKDSAIKEMKERVLKEFKKREASEGAVKMKWDAQVKMRQSKLLAAGQKVGRSNTVMLMMEESMDKAKADILLKFAEIENKENFLSFDFGGQIKVVHDIAIDVEMMVVSLFDIHMDKSVGAQGEETDAEDEEVSVSEVEVEEDDKTVLTVASNADDTSLSVAVVSDKRIVPYDKNQTSASAFTDTQLQRFRLAVQGKYFYNPSTEELGETSTESTVRRAMDYAEPPNEIHLLNRIRAQDNSLTLLKASGILLENPTKRLLLKYVEGARTDEALQVDLSMHFKLVRHQKEFVNFLRCLVESDFERGKLMRDLAALENESEAGLRCWFKDAVESGVNDLSDLLERRVLNSDHATEDEIFATEMTKAENAVEKFDTQATEIIDAILKLRMRSKKVTLSQQQVRRKLMHVQQLNGRRYGVFVPPVLITVADRHNWLLRYYSALKGSEDIESQRESKYEEIRSVCAEFISIATADALIILSENFLPPFSKTIPIGTEYLVHGRSLASGRGHDGDNSKDNPLSTSKEKEKRRGSIGGADGRIIPLGGGEAAKSEAGPKHYTYELHNIIYTVIEDHNGVFNGSDDFAMKAAGNDRKASLEFAKTHVKRIQVPLTVTVDYFGFRVLAVSKLPSERILFSPDGDVRRVTEELVHGLQSNGDFFINKSKDLQVLLEGASRQLNLVKHHCHGVKDKGPKMEITHISGDTTVYKDEGAGSEDAFNGSRRGGETYYLRDFWRTFPPEVPEFTQHLTRAPRDQSVFWRILRPELVRNYGTPLNPDAGCLLSQRAPDRDKHFHNICEATKSISEKLVPEMLELLVRRDFESNPLPLSEGYGLDLAKELHCRGINVRHLGLARSMLFRPLYGSVNIYFNEQFLRTSKDLRLEVKNGDRVRININGMEGPEFTICETEKCKITHDRLPISICYMGTSVNNATAIVGSVSSDKHSAELRSIFLAEIVARCLKSLIRLQLRNYSRNIKGVSTHFKGRLLMEYFNVVTGSNPQSNHILIENVFETITERFGPLAVLQSERTQLQSLLEPCLVFVIKRLQAMMGLRLSMASLAAFIEQPVGFKFCDLDFLDICPVVRFNLSMYPYAEAMTALLAADRAQRETYSYQVVADGASVFLRLCERKGCRSAENTGSLKKEFQSFYNRGCELERVPGPERSDPFSRSAGFSPGVLCALDTKFHQGVMGLTDLSHFTVEVHAQCLGGMDTLRHAVSAGRFSISVNRENYWSFQLSIRQYDISMRLEPAVMDRWVYIAATFDGVTVRCYVDSVLSASLEVAAPLKARQKEEMADRAKCIKDLLSQEKRESNALHRDIAEKVKSFFNSKDGITKMKRVAKTVLEDPAFHERDFGFTAREDLTESGIMKIKKAAAMKEAKNMHTNDIFNRMSRELVERFKQLRSEVAERASREDSEGELRAIRPIRVGAAISGSSSLADTTDNFYGDIGLVSVYPLCLPADRVRAHFLAAHSGKAKEAQRLYALTSSKFEDALQFAHDDTLILKGYAKVLCAYLRAEQASQLTKQGSSGAITKIMEAIAKFSRLNLPEGIGEILLELPRDPEFAGIVSFGFLSMKKLDNSFFSRGTSLSRKDMIMMPQIFGLDHPRSPADYIATAGGMYKEVCRDFELRMSYGDIDLSWLADITSPELVIALVKNAQEDNCLKSFNVGDIYRASGRSECLTAVTDEDVKVLGEHMLLSQVFDFAGCNMLTNLSITALMPCQFIRALNFDHCSLIDDEGLQSMLLLSEGLEVLSLQGLTHITDKGLIPIFRECHRLKIVNVSNCPQVTGTSLEILAVNNKLLTTFSAAATQLSDSSFTLISSTLSRTNLTSVDVSFCRDITDNAIVTLAESCPNLKHLNLCGLSRVADRGIQALCSKCWRLESLNLEDVFLFDDSAFWFSPHLDGRPLADENMLKALKTLNLRDCVCVTDYGMKGLAERCRAIESLVLRGCEKITDAGLHSMTQTIMERTQHKHPMCETLRHLDLSFCCNVTAVYLSEQLLPLCKGVHEIHLSGINSIDDHFVHLLCECCPSVQTLSLQKCIQITDVSLCWMADFLWLESLDLSGCYRISDSGVDVLTLACTGLQHLHLRRCSKITGVGVTSIGRNLRNLGLLSIDVRDCPRIPHEAVLDLQHNQQLVQVL